MKEEVAVSVGSRKCRASIMRRYEEAALRAVGYGHGMTDAFVSQDGSDWVDRSWPGL